MRWGCKFTRQLNDSAYTQGTPLSRLYLTIEGTKLPRLFALSPRPLQLTLSHWLGSIVRPIFLISSSDRFFLPCLAASASASSGDECL